MKVLIVHPNGTGEIKDVSSFNDVLNGDIIDERIFVDKTIALIRSEDAPIWEMVNEAVTIKRIRGTVIFAKSKNSYEKYTDFDAETIEKLLLRFPKIKIKEKGKCQKTSLSLWERLRKAITRLSEKIE